MTETNQFFSAYIHADFIGKMIFWALFILSLVAWTIMIYKIWAFYKVKKDCQSFYHFFQDKKEEPLKLIIDNPKKFTTPLLINPYLDIYKTLKSKTVEILNKNNYFQTTDEENPAVYLSREDMDLVESHIFSTIAKSIKWLEKQLFLLPTIVTLGPFLGLLGTVWGILITFSELQTKAMLGNTNSAILAGLSMALATTVLGLAVAIPALIGNSYLKAAVKEMQKDMEHYSIDLLGSLEMQYRKVQ